MLSLRAGETCAALSAGVRLDAEGAVQESRICRSWVRPRYGLTYDDGDELIELAPPGDEDLADLSLLLSGAGSGVNDRVRSDSIDRKVGSDVR